MNQKPNALHQAGGRDILKSRLLGLFIATKKRKIHMDALRRAVETESPMDMAGEKKLLGVLEELVREGMLKLPAAKGTGWPTFGILPKWILLSPPPGATAAIPRKHLRELKERTPWEPLKMASIAANLTRGDQLKKARAVNQYFLNRKADTSPIPHRERALEIFGNEKALDNHVHKGLFSGRISLEELDCFYCPEPLPYEAFSLDPKVSANRPLLLVENSATFWSCCRANAKDHPLGGGFFAAVVFGKGFKATQSTPIPSLDSLERIQAQTRARGIHYFGDLDPAGLAIPQRINTKRKEKDQSLLIPAQTLYSALLKKNRITGYPKPQDRFHDTAWVHQWLGTDISTPYLEGCGQHRWPQEGLTADDIARALAAAPDIA